MTDLIFVTGNENKAKFMAQHLAMPIDHRKLDLDELQTMDLHTVVEHKVRQAYDIVKQPVVVEDATLTFPAMGRLPGTLIKWFIEELGYDGLLKLANSLDSQEAIGLMCYGYFDGTELRFFDGEMRGHIAKEVRGDKGFGFDPIFINDGYDITRAEMTESDYAETSYRTPAIEKLRAFLQAKA